jgi:hypothetical protein
MGQLRRIKPDPEADLARLSSAASPEAERERSAWHAHLAQMDRDTAALLVQAGWSADEVCVLHCAREALGIIGADGTEQDLVRYLRAEAEEFAPGSPLSEEQLRALANGVRAVAARPFTFDERAV